MSPLWREVRDRGFGGSRSSLVRYLARAMDLRSSGDAPALRRPASMPVPGPHTATWLLVGEPTLEPVEARFVERLCALCPEVQATRELVLSFFQCVRERQWARLDPWLEAAEKSGLPEMGSFARGLKQDREAVVAAMTYEWSNGPVEGFVNRIKEIKRRMFGRANFDLLRRMVLQAP